MLATSFSGANFPKQFADAFLKQIMKFWDVLISPSQH